MNTLLLNLRCVDSPLQKGRHDSIVGVLHAAKREDYLESYTLGSRHITLAVANMATLVVVIESLRADCQAFLSF